MAVRPHRPLFRLNRSTQGGRLVSVPRTFSVAGEQTPLGGSLSGLVSHVSIDAVTDYVVVDAAGVSNKLGQFTVTVPHFVHLPTRTAIGTYEFTAANGDKLYADFTGQAAPTATPGVISIVETATITGGTGRFAGATGGFVAERLFDRIAGTTVGFFSGTVSSPGS